jgi:hypothetical protein
MSGVLQVCVVHGAGQSIVTPLSPTCDCLPCSTPLLRQASALCYLPTYLGVIVNLAAKGWLIDGISTAQWPAEAEGAAKLCSTVAGAHGTQAGGWGLLHPQHHQQLRQLPSLPCLSQLLLALVQAPSAADEPPACEQELFQRIAAALAARSGLAASCGARGYTSPGLLHLLLGTHLRLLLDDAAEKPGSAMAQHRAVNALHLLRALLQQPGLQPGTPQQQEQEQEEQEQCTYGARLLLPCLARPLTALLTAPPGTCAVVQYQVYRLLQAVLFGGRRPPPLLASDAGAGRFQAELAACGPFNPQ